jgi:predicted RNA-binding protein YlqC (UPF0109 family)
MSDYVEGDINTIEDADELEDEAGYDEDDLDDSDLDDSHLDDNDLDDSDLDDSDLDDNVGNVVAGSEPEKVLVYLARSLARDPDAVVVEADERGGKLKLSLHVGPGDMGRVIGRRGRTAQAIRALVAVSGARSGVSTNVDIVDD